MVRARLSALYSSPALLGRHSTLQLGSKANLSPSSLQSVQEASTTHWSPLTSVI